jgi:hypothetical protein
MLSRLYPGCTDLPLSWRADGPQPSLPPVMDGRSGPAHSTADESVHVGGAGLFCHLSTPAAKMRSKMASMTSFLSIV